MRNNVAKLFSKVAAIAIAIALSIGLVYTAGTVTAKAEGADITQYTTTQRTYQGQDNWYYLTGDFSENQIYRMYFNYADNWWQGYGHRGNCVSGGYNTLNPIGADVMLAYVVPEFGGATVYGRTILSSGKAISAKIVHRSVAGVDTVIYSEVVSDASADGVPFEAKTLDVKAGDVFFFVAETAADLDVWQGITFDAGISITKKAGKSENAVSALNATSMPLTGALNVTVTGGCVDYHVILTESMKLRQDAIQKYAYRGTTGGFGLFDYDVTAVSTGDPYRLAGMNFNGDCHTGVQQYRVFHSNNSWTGAPGMIYYAPTNGFVTVIGKTVVGGTCDIVKVSAATGATTLVKTLAAGTYDLNDVAEAKNIAVNTGDFVGIFFDGACWTTASYAGAFDFYAAATVATETVVAPTAVEISSESIVEGAIALKVGESATVTATVTPAYATDTTVTWSVEGDAVTVENGVITAVKVGTATVTATANGNGEVKASVTVNVSPILPESVVISSESIVEGKITLEVDGTATVTATVTPDNATDATVTWESSDESVVTVVNGVITAVGAGTANVTVTANGNEDVKATVEVTVNAKQPVDTGSEDTTIPGDTTDSGDTTVPGDSTDSGDTTVPGDSNISGSDSQSGDVNGCFGGITASGLGAMLAVLAVAVIKSKKE